MCYNDSCWHWISTLDNKLSASPLPGSGGGSTFDRWMAAPFLASFPGSCVGREKRAWYSLFAYAQFSQDIWEFGNSRKICSVTLTSARHADFSCIKGACHWPRFLQTLTRERRRYSALRLQELSTRSSIPAKRCGTWMTQSFPLKFTDHLERSNVDRYRQSDIVFDSIPPVCVTQGVEPCSATFLKVNRNWP